MSWAPLLLLSALCHCANGQALTQPSSVAVSPGQNVKLSCKLSSGSMGTYYMAWYQQKHEGAPRCLRGIYSDSSKGQGDGVPSRFTASKDSSNRCMLTISGVQAEDDEDYYCGGRASGTSMFHTDTALWGSEIKSSSPVCTVQPASCG